MSCAAIEGPFAAAVQSTSPTLWRFTETVEAVRGKFRLDDLVMGGDLHVQLPLHIG